ncbi:hypothetical protein NQ314_011483 [Rhamnusium bicolor]|uniref:Regulatory protein zeste n=1 Tax=Rhamnusium bicolor TaxID=1586634 RepID=A0AAV8XIL5_9CUCU|nr:hypothetical protein NQ314_017677 [Rhamnusium bicolor]KAJ8938447.1 hypothetical protein NQ314_011483 [Rhamnusium bicolor]
MRVTNDHWNVLIQFAENHNEIITNRFHGLNGRQSCSKLWTDLTEQLNALGYGEKTTEEWKKTLADWKCKTKSKAAKIRQNQRQTGGGVPQNIVILSHNEERLLALMGTTALEGDSEMEYGIKRTISCSSSSIQNKSFTNQSGKKSKVCVNKENNQPKKAEISNEINYYEIPAMDLNNSNIVDLVDHNYNLQLDQPVNDIEVQSEVQATSSNIGASKSLPRRKQNDFLSSQLKLMNDETLNVLRSIQESIASIAGDIKRIANAQENKK